MVKCNYCNNECKSKYFGLRHPFWEEMAGIDIYVCQYCNSLITFPMPTEKLLSHCYSKNIGGWSLKQIDARRHSNQDQWYDHILKIFDLKKIVNKIIADVGAGEGFLASKLLDISQDEVKIHCYDMHSDPRAMNSRSVDVKWYEVDIASNNWWEYNKYDLVFCCSVIEHVIDPKKLLLDLKSIVSEMGFIHIIGPCSDSIACRTLGKKWPYIIAGEHLTIPSTLGMMKLADICDLNVVDLKKIRVTYSTKYIVETLTQIKMPNSLDFTVKLPIGAFSMILAK